MDSTSCAHHISTHSTRICVFLSLVKGYFMGASNLYRLASFGNVCLDMFRSNDTRGRNFVLVDYFNSNLIAVVLGLARF